MLLSAPSSRMFRPRNSSSVRRLRRPEVKHRATTAAAMITQRRTMLFIGWPASLDQPSYGWLFWY